MAEGSTEAQQWPSAEVPPGSESRARTHGGPPGTWEILSFPSTNPDGAAGDQPLVCGSRARAHGSEQRAQRRYRGAKATKRPGTDGRKSERLIVPRKRGNQPKGPRGGKEAPEHGTDRGKYGRDPSSITVSTKLERIAKLAKQQRVRDLVVT